MKKNLILLFLLANCLAGRSQAKQASCMDFRTGTFSYRDSATSQVREFTRTRKSQQEVNKATGVSVKYRIEWPDSCTYTLTQIYSNSKEWRKRNNSSVTYKIIAATAASYTYQCVCADGVLREGVVVKMW